MPGADINVYLDPPCPFAWMTNNGPALVVEGAAPGLRVSLQNAH